jgi:proteasome lid subunit RPN8/RPN11
MKCIAERACTRAVHANSDLAARVVTKTPPAVPIAWYLPKKQHPRVSKRMTTRQPTLRFSPTAYAKLIYLRDRGPTEVGAFAITERDDPLYVTDVKLIKQRCTSVTTAFEDAAIHRFFEDMVDAGLHPAQFSRVWVHTHPGDSPQPSGTDVDTFRRVFGECDWSVMFIIARGGQTYAQLAYNVGPPGSMVIPVHVDYRRAFVASDHAAWAQEYKDNVQQEVVSIWPMALGKAPVLLQSGTGERSGAKAKTEETEKAQEPLRRPTWSLGMNDEEYEEWLTFCDEEEARARAALFGDADDSDEGIPDGFHVVVDDDDWWEHHQ